MNFYRGWNRDISIMKHVLRKASDMKPEMPCLAKNPTEFESWKRKLKTKLHGLMSPWPKRISPKARIIARAERTNDIIEKFVIHVEKDLVAPGYLMLPKGLKNNERRPAILVCHGHEGREKICGMSQPHDETQKDLPANYAQALAEHGYIVAVIDSRGFGERGLPGVPQENRCNTLYLLYGILGEKLLTLNIHDHLQALDYLLSRQEVDPSRVAVLGRSFGGTLSQYLGVFDDRIKAVGIICYLCKTLEYAIEDVSNNCGSQFIPSLYKYADVATIAGLIAPRPCLVQSGIGDECFAIDSAASAHKELHDIYRRAGAKDRLSIEIFAGRHQFHAPSAFRFMDKWLQLGS